MRGIPVTLHPLLAFAAWLLILDFTLIMFLLPIPRWLYAPRWAAGWLVPHAERQEVCRVRCATCR